MTSDYDILGVAVTASEEEIKAAYRKLVQELHPDRYADNPLAYLAEEKLKKVNGAYERICEERAHRGDNQTPHRTYQAPEQQTSENRPDQHDRTVVHFIFTGENEMPVILKILHVILRILAAPVALLVLGLSLFGSFVTTITAWIFIIPGGGIGFVCLVKLAETYHSGVRELSAYASDAYMLGFSFLIFMVPAIATVTCDLLAALSAGLISFVSTGKFVFQVQNVS